MNVMSYFLDRLFVLFCRVLFVGCCAGLVEAQTLYAFSEDQWTDSFKICFDKKLVERPYSKTLKPQKDWDANHSALLDLEAMPKEKRLFALSNTSLQKQALLYVLDSETGCEQGHKSLGIPLSRGVVRASTVFYEKRWQLMLSVLGEDAIEGRVHLWIFDLGNAGNPLSLIHHEALPASYRLGAICLKPLFIRRIGGGASSVLWTVQEGTRGVVCCLDLETQKISKIHAESGAFYQLNAIDQWGRGICDVLYLVNEQGLWRLSLEDPRALNFKHLAKLRVDSKIMVVPHTEHPGWHLYFLGQKLGKEGLWTLELLEQEDSRRSKLSSWFSEPECLLEGAFFSLDLCAGRVWLMPRHIEKPWVWEIANKVLITPIFRDVFSEGCAGSVLGTQLVWDGQHKEYKIILVNQESQITVFAGSVEAIDTGRLAFRKS